MSYLLLFSIFVIATCGLVYELIAGTLASYLLGDSITQFSTIIGVYLFSMGIGSYLSKFITKNLISFFINVEFLIGLVGGFSAAILFTCFEFVSSFRILLYSIVSITGILVGFEIPILMRILQNHFEFKDLVSKVFTFDYIGALLASLLFPLFLVPHLGLIKSSFLFGIFNVLTGLWSLHLFQNEVSWIKTLKGFGTFSLLFLIVGFIYSERILSFSEGLNYPDKIIYSKSSKYQRIVLTKSPMDYRLFLNGNLQFSSKDEYRYHEGLVHVGLSLVSNPKNILVLGGGDGLAVREILKYPRVEKILLVDLDPGMTKLFSENLFLTQINELSLKSPKVKIINDDAFLWLKKNTELFDFIIVDFPDPSNFSVGKLYSHSFYQVLKKSLTPHALGVIQSTSPYIAKQSFWCIHQTLKATQLNPRPYHFFIPSFGEWGFNLISHEPVINIVAKSYPKELKFVNNTIVPTFFTFPNDMILDKKPPQINKLNNQILVRLFDKEWADYGK